MRIVFFGSSEFSIPFLKAFSDRISLVITTEDKVRGRGKKLKANCVKDIAISENIKCIAIKKFDKESLNQILEVQPEVFLVVSFGKIIPKSFLSVPKCAINLHPSPLPLYRGAAPIERQIMDGVTHSKVCIMKVVPELDAGDILLEENFNISIEDTKEDVERRVVDIGIPMIEKVLNLVEKGNCEGKPQEGISSYAQKITKEDERIKWNKLGVEVHNKVRALSPSPGAFTFFRGKVLKIFRTGLDKKNYKEKPGTIVEVGKDYFAVQCLDGIIKVLDVQIEGRKRVLANDFINGNRPQKGEILM